MSDSSTTNDLLGAIGAAFVKNQQAPQNQNPAMPLQQVPGQVITNLPGNAIANTVATT